MDIMELGAIGELVGGVAVVGSLIYVGLQVRQSNALNRAESVRAFVRDFNTVLMQIKDPGFTDIWRRGCVDFHALTRTEQSQLHSVLLHHLMLGWGDSMINPQRSGDLAQFLDTAFAGTVGAPGFAQWWDQMKTILRPMAPTYVDRIDAIPRPDMLAGAPWYAPDGAESEEA